MHLWALANLPLRRLHPPLGPTLQRLPSQKTRLLNHPLFRSIGFPQFALAPFDRQHNRRHPLAKLRMRPQRRNKRLVAQLPDRHPQPSTKSLKPNLPCIGLNRTRMVVAINEMPNEVANSIRFSQDRTHAAYDASAAHRFWRALVQVDRLFKLFRSSFLGKTSPIHFFWGSFDLAVTRFSGRPAPLHPGGVPVLPDEVTREAYSHEVSSAGFWPGSDAFPRAAFYSYAYPEPAGFRDKPITPGGYFDTTLGEFILPYNSVSTAPDPDALLLDFLSTTYTAAAETGGWDRAALECSTGVAGRVRRL